MISYKNCFTIKNVKQTAQKLALPVILNDYLT